MIYTSVENEKIKYLKKLLLKKYRDLENLFIVEGEHIVLEAYKKGLLKTLIVKEKTIFNLDIDTMIVSEKVLKYISELETPQPIMGICYKIKEQPLTDKLLILSDIQDPGNLGTILRSSVAFNIKTIVLSESTVDIYNSKVIRASQGMIFSLNIIIKDLKTYLQKLKQEGYIIYGTDVENGKDIKTIEKKKKLAIIVGNEGNGISSDIKKLTDENIYIKTNENCESLNVAVATSIILYEIDK